MKGLYLTLMNIGSLPGYAKKIYGQVNAFRNNGIYMDLMALNNNQIILEKQSNNNSEKRVIIKNFIPYPYNNRLQLFASALKYIKYRKINLIYIRYALSDPLYLIFLNNLRAISPDTIVFAEIPTYPYDHFAEYKNSYRSRLLLTIDRLCRNYLKRYVDRFIGVDSKIDIFGVKTISIQNGIDINYLNQVNLPRILSPCLRLIGVANLMDYHGFDRIISGMTYNSLLGENKQNIEFHIVSPPSSALDKLRKIVIAEGLAQQVIFHGAKFDKDLDKLYNYCHIAVGCLALHRANYEQASSLKSREYMARGIPFIFSGTEKIIPENFLYALQIPLCEEPVNLNSVMKFAQMAYGNIDHPNEMRLFASTFMNWSYSLLPVFKEIELMANESEI